MSKLDIVHTKYKFSTHKIVDYITQNKRFSCIKVFDSSDQFTFVIILFK